MVNQWVEFVKKYAKENNISYAHAIKEASPAYHQMKKRGKKSMRGKGLDDLPDEISENMYQYLDDEDLENLFNVTQGSRERELIRRFLQRRRQLRQDQALESFNRLMVRVRDLTTRHNKATVVRRHRPDIIDELESTLPELESMQNNQLLNEQNRETVGNQANLFRQFIRNIQRGSTNVGTL